MNIFDVISNVSRSSKCTKIVVGWGFAPDRVAGFKETCLLYTSDAADE